MDIPEHGPDSTDPLERLASLIHCVPFIRALDRVDLARLISVVEHVRIPAGTLIFAEGEEADALYLLEAGRVRVSIKTSEGERSVAELEGPTSFGELGVLLARRTGTARALTDISAWKLPRQRFEHLIRERPIVGVTVARSLAELIDHRSRGYTGTPATPEARPPLILASSPVVASLAWRLVGGAIVLGIPLALWWLPPPAGLSLQGWRVSSIVLAAAVAWLFEPVPDFVIALAMPTAWGLAGLVSPSVAFAGFASSSWLLALGALGLATAMVRSGLLFRIALFFLKTFPTTQAGQVLALLTSGVVVTSLVPLAIARVVTVAPLTQELTHGLGYPPKSRASAALTFAGLIGYGAFSSIFLTGLAMNFFVLNLLPQPDRLHFAWLTWLEAGAPAGAVIFVGAITMLLVLFRAKVGPKVTPGILRHQQRILGPLSRNEMVTIAALAVLLVGLLLQPLLRIDGEWFALSALVLLIAGGAHDPTSFLSSLDWGFLILFGVLLGTGDVLRSVGVDRWIADALIPLTRTVGHSGILIVLLAAGVVVFRIILRWIPATLLLSLVLVPAAPRLGVSPWIVGFVVLMAANTWLHPRQSDFCRLTRDATKGETFTDHHGVIVGVGMTVLTLLALTVSVPYWRAIGLLSP